MIKTSSIIGKVQHIRNPVCTNAGFIEKFLNEQVNFVVYTGAGLELTELSVACKLVTERLLTALEDKIAEIDHLVVERFPYNVTNTRCKGIIVIEVRCPAGQGTIIGCARHTACPVV